MTTETSKSRRSRLGRTSALIALVAATALVVAACGSSKKSAPSSSAAPGGSSTSASAAGTATAPTGTPIKVMTLASVNYNGPTYRNILTSAEIFGKFINAHGGIAGHPLEVTTCDEQGDPNKTAKCGRDAVSNGAVAAIGSFTLNGESIIPILAAAKTSWFGICCPASASELTNPVVTVLGSGLSIIGGEVVKAVQDGCKKMSLVILDTGAQSQFTITLVKNALKSANGPALKSTVLVPLTAQDYSPQVAQAVDGTDCILGGIGEANYPAFLSAFASSGGKQRIYGAQGNLDAKVVKPFAKETEGGVVVGAYSDLSLPAWDDYRSAIATYNAPAGDDYNSLGGLGTWAAYEAFKEIVEKMTGPINHDTFLAAASKATTTFPGVAANVDFSKPFEGLGKSFVNAVNRSITYDIIHNGKLVPFQEGKFYDMTNAMVGTPLTAENLPPAGQ